MRALLASSGKYEALGENQIPSIKIMIFERNTAFLRQILKYIAMKAYY